jgi:phospholipid/cholesterol/gamma-HCH transport system substrate-binding protein
VGEITDLRLDVNDARHVMATILVDPSTPIRSDTRISIETQGLIADASAGRDMMQSARDTLNRLNDILKENAEPLHNAVVNIDTFSGALSRNSGKLDGIMDGLARLTGAAPPPSPRLYDLSAVTIRTTEPLPDKQLVVSEPTAVIALDTRKIVTLAAHGEQQGIPDAQWSDNIPKLIQARVVQSFEDAKFMKVSRPLDGLASEFQLTLDLRGFHVTAGDKPEAIVEFAAKILDKDGHILAGNVFRATHPVVEFGTSATVASLNDAFGKVTAELVTWTLATLRGA